MDLGRREFLIGSIAASGVVSAGKLFGLGGTSGDQVASLPPRQASDDTEAVRALFRDALKGDGQVDGGEKIYSVRGNLKFSGARRLQIRSLRLRQLSPAKDRKTLHLENCDQIRIDALEIDRGETRTPGSIGEAAGLWVEGGSGHAIRNVDVHGGGGGNGIVIWGTESSRYGNFHIHDMVYDIPDATDDILQGIWLNNNSNCSLTNPMVNNLAGNADRQFPNRFTRAIALGGNVAVEIVNAEIRDAWQAVDITGSTGNRQIKVLGGRCFQTNVGVKLANSAVDCRVSDFVAERVGQYAFGAGGPAEAGLQYKTRDCEFANCTALDVGYNRIRQRHSGFDVHTEDYDQSFPQGIRFVACRAIDRQAVKTMEYGFFCNVPPARAVANPNVMIDCSSSGFTKAASFGFAA
jgi:hypothetical protein